MLTAALGYAVGGIAVEQYAEAKRFPLDFLTSIHVSEFRHSMEKVPVVRIPYFDPEGIEIELPLDPVQLARLIAPERGAVYRRLGLHPVQIEAAEAAARLVIGRDCRAGSRRADR